MKKNMSLKFQIVTDMLFVTILIVTIISILGVINSTKIIKKSAEKSFALSAEKTATQIYSDFNLVSYNTNLLAKLISRTSDINSPVSMLRLKKNSESEYSKLRSITKFYADNTKGVKSIYFYFDQKYAPSYDGDWFLNKNGQFQRNINNSAIQDNKDGAWYFNPIKQKKAVWSLPYVDADTKIPMITYSMPVYKNKFLLGIVGMDIALDDLNNVLGSIDIYKGIDAILLDANYNVIAGKGFNVGDNFASTNSSLFKTLSKETSKMNNGYIEHTEFLTKKIMAYSILPNKFILLLDVPVKNIPTNLAQTICILIVIALVAILISVFFAIRLGNFIATPIKNAITGLNVGAEEVSSASSQVATASQSLAEGTSEQAAAIQETSATLEETSSMVHQNRENTQQAVALAKRAKSFALQCDSEMQKMSNSMSELKNSSNEIAKIIKVIDEIAFQTNILSLNAAVEAARAGEVGKGFAVVAEEVRNLAQRSAQAAKDTTVIIENNIDLSENSVSIAKIVKEAVQSIEDETNKVNDLLEEISVATNEQSQGVDQINKAVSQLEDALQTNAATADESAIASRALQEQAVNVREIVDSLLILVDGTNGTNSKI